MFFFLSFYVKLQIFTSMHLKFSKYLSSCISTLKPLQVNFQHNNVKYTCRFKRTCLASQVHFKSNSSFTSTILTLLVHFQLYKYISSFTSTFLALLVHLQLYKYNSSFASTCLTLKVHILLCKYNCNFTSTLPSLQVHFQLYKYTSSFTSIF